MSAEHQQSSPQNTPDPRRWLALAVILSATLLSVIDFLIVNIALPSIREEMHATDAEIQLTVAGYGLAFAVSLITGGRLGDIFGRKRVFQVGMLGFTLTSALCGFANSPAQLVIFRVLQGLTAAMMTPQVLATIQVTFEGSERDKATGILGAVVGVGSFAGNVLGGWLVEANLFNLGWRPIFFVNVPIGLTALVLSQLLMRDSRSANNQKLDLVGSAISAIGLFCLIFPISEGREKHWPWWAFAMLAVVPFFFWLFIRYEKALAARGGSPLVNMDLFASGGFGRGLFGILLLFSGISSFSLTLTLFLQDGLHTPPGKVGTIFAAMSVSFLISSLTAVKVVQKLGPSTLLIGLTIMQVGQLALILIPLLTHGRMSPYVIMPILFLYGLGQGLCVPQLIRQTLNNVSGVYAGAAAGVLNTTQQIAFTVGVSMIGGLFFVVLGTSRTPASYANALAAAFTCNFIFVLITRLLVAHNIRRQTYANASTPAVLEA